MDSRPPGRPLPVSLSCQLISDSHATSDCKVSRIPVALGSNKAGCWDLQASKQLASKLEDSEEPLQSRCWPSLAAHCLASRASRLPAGPSPQGRLPRRKPPAGPRAEQGDSRGQRPAEWEGLKGSAKAGPSVPGPAAVQEAT